MSRILTHLTVAVLGLTPLTAGVKTVAVATADQAPVMASCSPSDCPMPACCDDCCDESCELMQSAAAE